MKLIGIVTSIPAAGTKPGTGAAIDSFSATQNTLEIVGKCSAGSGKLVLLRWHDDIGVGEWRRWLQDRPIAVDSAADGGEFSARYVLGGYAEQSFLLLNADSLTITDCYCGQITYR